VGHSNAKHYKSKAVTEIGEFDGPHLLPAIDGWEEGADFALDWALKHAERRWPTTPQPTIMTRRTEGRRFAGRASEASVSGGGQP
jgi:hypothetical protein